MLCAVCDFLSVALYLCTTYRDYQIEANREQQWICVGGIRSTGLTAATGIAEHVVQNLFGKELLGEEPTTTAAAASTNMMGVSESAASSLPFSASSARSDSNSSSDNNSTSRPPFKFDSLAQMSEDYVQSVKSNNSNNDCKSEEGYLVLDGCKYRVTHPISSFGMENYQYIAQIHEQRRTGDR